MPTDALLFPYSALAHALMKYLLYSEAIADAPPIFMLDFHFNISLNDDRLTFTRGPLTRAAFGARETVCRMTHGF